MLKVIRYLGIEEVGDVEEADQGREEKRIRGCGYERSAAQSKTKKPERCRRDGGGQEEAERGRRSRVDGPEGMDGTRFAVQRSLPTSNQSALPESRNRSSSESCESMPRAPP